MTTDSSQKPVVYLLPGLLCDATVWAHQIAALVADYDVRVADFTAMDSIAAMATWVLDAAPARFSVAGHSMGARVAMEIVRRAPERVVRLALLDTGTHAMRPGEREKRQELLDLADAQGMSALAERWLPPMVHPGRADDPTIMTGLRAMVERMSPAIYRRQITALLGRPDAAIALPHIGCPVLVGVGREDGWSPPAQHAQIAAAIPQAHYVIFENSGHMAPLEAPDEVTAALCAWMRDAAPAGVQLTAPERLAIEHACERQIRRFARYNDAADYAALVALFTEDGSFARPTDPENPVRGRAAILAFFRDRPARRTCHLMCNTVVEAETRDRARAHSYVVLYTGSPAEEPSQVTTTMIGDFHDILVLTDGEWLFQHRRGTLSLKT